MAQLVTEPLKGLAVYCPRRRICALPDPVQLLGCLVRRRRSRRRLRRRSRSGLVLRHRFANDIAVRLLCDAEYFAEEAYARNEPKRNNDLCQLLAFTSEMACIDLHRRFIRDEGVPHDHVGIKRLPVAIEG